MKKIRLMKQGLAVLLSLSMSLGPYVPGSFAAFADIEEVSSDVETGIGGVETDIEDESGSKEGDEAAVEKPEETVEEAEAPVGRDDSSGKTENETASEEKADPETDVSDETAAGRSEDETASGEKSSDQNPGEETQTEQSDQDKALENEEEHTTEQEKETAGIETVEETAEVPETGGSAAETEAEAEEEEEETEEAEEAVPGNILQAEVEDVLVTVSYEKDVFPEKVTMEVSLLDVDSEDQMEITGKVLKVFNRDAEKDSYSAVNTQAFDIRIFNEDGEELQPDNGAGKVYVSFSHIERPEIKMGKALKDEALHVFHMEDAGDEKAEELEKLDTNEEDLLFGNLLAAEGAVINDVAEMTGAEEAGSAEDVGENVPDTGSQLPETAAVTVEAEHFSLYVLSWRVGNMFDSTGTALYDGNTYSIAAMLSRGDMLDIHGFDTDLSDQITAAQIVSGSEVISINSSQWTITARKAGSAVFDVSYFTVNGGKTTNWVSRIAVTVKYYAEGVTSGNCGVSLTWSVSGTTLTISGIGEMYDYTDVINDYAPSVSPWASYTKKITTVKLDEGVVSAGSYAFYGFENLTSLSLPSTLTRIGDYAFRDCMALESLALPDALTEVGTEAFRGCNELGNFTVPASVTRIGSRAFYKDRLASGKTKNVITNRSSVVLRGLHEYNQNYSSCPTGKEESEAVLTDTVSPSILSLVVTGVTDRNAEFKVAAKDNLKEGLEILGFVTTESTVTNPERVLENGRSLAELGEWDDYVTVSPVSGGYRYDMNESILIFGYNGTETQLDPDTTYYLYTVARDMNGNHSSIVKKTFRTAAETACITPLVSLASGTYIGSQTVTMTARTADSVIRYEYGGNTFTYTGPFTLAPSGTEILLYVWAEKEGLTSSGQDFYSYTILENSAMSGNCGASGNDLTWQLISEGAGGTSGSDLTLVIQGNGAMQDFTEENRAPWYSRRESIRHIQIKSGVTTIGNYAFQGLDRADGELVIPDSVTKVGDYSFSMNDIDSLALGKGLKTIGSRAFYGMYETGDFTIPVAVTAIGDEAFYAPYRYNGAGKQSINNRSAVELTAGNQFNENCQTVMSSKPVRDFLKRMYSICMGREADAGGLNYWTENLLTGKLNGKKKKKSFVFSNEFTGKNYCNRHFVQQIYPALMGREPDTGGFNYWVGKLDSGEKREVILNSFACTAEYKNLCEAAGFGTGTAIEVPKYGTQPYGPCAICGEKTKVVQFVERLYTKCLNRNAETGGLNYWSKALCNHTVTAQSLLHSFFLSAEIRNSGISNGEYVKRIYRTMMDREPDTAGLNYWKGRLDSGDSPKVVINGFVNSTEFVQICSSYGIQRQ